MFSASSFNNRKGYKSNQPRRRTMKIESLEERDLLSVSPMTDYQELAAAYSSNFSNSETPNFIDVTELTADNLRAAIEQASQTAEDDVVIIRTSAASNAINLDGSALVFDVDSDQYGSITLASCGDSILTISNTQQNVALINSGEIYFDGISFLAQEPVGQTFQTENLVVVSEDATVDYSRSMLAVEQTIGEFDSTSLFTQNSTSAITNDAIALSSLSSNKTYAITTQIDDTKWAYVTGLFDPDSYWIQNWDYTGNCWGMVSDAEKSRYYPTDDNLCWAATASNMLWYTGWVNSYLKDDNNKPFTSSNGVVEQRVFQYFMDHFTDGTGNANNANLWFLTGNYTPIGQYSSQLKMDGGGFYPNINPQDVINYYTANSSVSFMKTMSELLHEGYGIALTLQNSNTPIGHEVTLWGYVYDTSADNESYYQAVLISDPDDENMGIDSHTYLTSIELIWNSEKGRYYLANYNDNNYYIDGFCTLAPFEYEYNTHDIECLRTFLEQTDENGVKNGKHINDNYDPNNPSTWDVTWTLVNGDLNVNSISYYDSNLVGSLNVSGCRALEYINCENNHLTSLNTSGCTKLGWIHCDNNQLTTLDASGCTELYKLHCVNNQLITLNVSGCAELYELYFYDNSQLRTLDASGCTSLTSLNCSSNQLTSLNVSGCTSLTSLNCSSNQLTSLNVSGCTSLTSLNCSSNQLTSLDVSECTALAHLICVYNQLTSLNLSECTMLSIVNCEDNPFLQSIIFNYLNPNIYISYWLSDVFDSNGKSASDFFYDSDFHRGFAFPLTGMNYGHTITIDAVSSTMPLVIPELYVYTEDPTTVSVSIVSGVDYASGYLLEYSTDPNFTNSKSKDISIYSTLINDLNANTEYYFRVKALGSGNYRDSIFSKTIKVKTPPIKLETPALNVNTDGPKSISVTVGSVDHASAYLLKYWVDSNSGGSWATQIVPAGKTIIEKLYPKTEYYFCVMALGSEDYSNSEYSSTEVATTEVDYVSSEILHLRAFFEQCDSNGVKNGTKINSNYDANDPTTWTCITWLENDGINYVNKIEVVSKQLVGSLDLSGFIALDKLYCSSNNLTSLNVSGCTELSFLYCNSNNLTSLNVSGCTELEYLYCYNCQLTTLNVSECTSLYSLDCSSNQLTSLNLLKNDDLRSLYCDSNQLSFLDLSMNPKLQNLTCWNPQLHIIRLSSSTQRYTLSIYTPCSWVFKDANNEVIGTSFEDPDYSEYYYRLSTYTELPIYATDGAQTVIFTDTPIENMVAPALSVVVTGSNSVSVNVGSVANASEYKLEYSSNPNFTNPEIMIVSSGISPISGLAANTIYYFRAMTIGTGVFYDSDYSSIISAKTNSATNPDYKLDTPTFNISTIGHNFVSLDINNVTNASGYRVQYSIYPDFSYSFEQNATAGLNTISGLNENTTYYFRVQAIGSGNYTDSSYSASKSATTSSLSTKLDTPRFHITETGIRYVSIKINSVANASGYRVQYSTNSNFKNAHEQTVSAGDNTISGLTPNTTYYFRVQAIGTGNYIDSDFSNDRNTTTLTDTSFDPYIDNVGDSISEAKEILFENNSFTFTDRLGEGKYGLKDVDIYKLVVSASDLGYSYTFTTSLPSDGTSVDTYICLFDSTGVEINYNDNIGDDNLYSSLTWTPSVEGTYYLGVSSLSNNDYDPLVAGSSTTNGSKGRYTLTVDQTVIPSQLDSPTFIITAIGSNYVTMDIDSVANASGYRIQYSTDQNFTNAESLIVQAGSNTINGLSANTKYYFRVQAIGSGYFTDSGFKMVQSLTTSMNTDIDNVGDSISDAKAIAFTNNSFAFTDRLGEGEYCLKDVDIYKLVVSASDIGRSYTFTTSQPSDGTSVDTYIRLFDSTGNELDCDDDIGDNSYYSSLTWTPSAAGTYYLGVSSYANRAYDPAIAGNATSDGSAGDYTLTVTRTAITNSFIDNVGDSISSAKAIAFTNNSFAFTDKLGEGVYGLKDVDIYKLVVSASDIGRSYTFTTSQPSDGTSVDTYIRLFDSTGDELGGDDDGGNDYRYSSLTWTPSAAGTYYLGVSSYANRAYDPAIAGSATSDGSAGDYTLTVTRTAITNTFIDNVGDSISNAKDIAFTNDAYTFTDKLGEGVYDLKDVDIYKLFVSASDINRSYTFTTSLPTGGASVDTYIRLFDSTGNELGVDDDGGNDYRYSSLTWTPPSSGSYYLGVSSYSNRAYDPAIAGSSESDGSAGDYTLTVTRTGSVKLFTPTLSVSSTTSDSITVYVGIVANASGFKAQYSTDSNFTEPIETIFEEYGSNTIYDLNPSQTYYIRVMALGSGNYSDSNFSSTKTATTKAASNKLNAPTFTVAVTGSDSVSINVDSVLHASGYSVQYSPNANFSNPKYQNVSVGSNTISGLSANTTYYFRVMAIASTNYTNSNYSAVQSVITNNEYSSSEVACLREFLEQTDSDGVKNGVKINSAYSADDASTWTGVTWSDIDGSMRVTEIDWDGKELHGSLNLSACTKLKCLYVSYTYSDEASRYNYLTYLDVTGCASLRRLSCGYNQLTELNVANNSLLEDLYCYYNQLTELNVSNNLFLTDIDCSDNQITQLNLESNLELGMLTCGGNPLGSLNVEKNVNLWQLNCSGCQLTSLDVSKNVNLTQLRCGYNQLTSLDVRLNTDLWHLDCRGNFLAELDLSNNAELREFYCDDNLLSSLDVTNNPLLRWFGCSYNRLSSLDVTNCTALKTLYCSKNQLTSLDVTNNTDLLTLYCNNNQLSILDVSNNTQLTSLACWSPNLRIVRINSAANDLYVYFDSVIWTFMDVNGNTLADYTYYIEYNATDSASLPITAVNPYDDQTISIIDAQVEALDAPSFSVSVTDPHCVSVNIESVTNASGYTVEYSVNPDFSNAIRKITSSGTASLDGLVNDSTYYIRVKANGNGAYADSNYSFAQTVVTGAASIAQKDLVETAQNHPITIDYRANDNLTDWSLSTVQFGEPPHGEFTVNADGTITYTPEYGFFGMDTIGYGVVSQSGRLDIGEISIYVGPPISASVQDASYSHNSSIPMSASVDSLTDWDNCFVELWAQGVNTLSAGLATVTLEYNPEVYNAPVFSDSANDVTWTISQSVQLPNGNVQVELTAQVLKLISSQTDNLYLGTVVLTPSEEGSGLEDVLTPEPVCVLNGVSLAQIVKAMPYDLAHNGTVDVEDFVAFATVFGFNLNNVSPDNPQYSQAVMADFNKDGVVNVDDFIMFATNFGASKAAAIKPVAQPGAASELRAASNELREDELNSECEIQNAELIDSQVEFSEMELTVPAPQPESPISQNSPCGASVIALPLVAPLPPSNHSQLETEAYSAALLDLYDNQDRADLTGFSNVLAESRMDAPIFGVDGGSSQKTSSNAIDAVLQEDLLTIDWKE